MGNATKRFKESDKRRSLGEWIEVPQFSDKEKVYRMPLTKHENAQRYLNSAETLKINNYGNWSRVDENKRRLFELQFGPPRKTETVFTSVKPEVVASSDAIPTQEVTTIDPIDLQSEEIVTAPTDYINDKIVVNGDQPFQALPEDNSENESPQEENSSSEKNSEEKINDSDKKGNFFAYIPIELFKRVHSILKSQPTTPEGRINYLKRFEESLLAEIEQRLVPVFTNVRTKRASRGDHGWDDHDDKGVGFPSLEGALMAIAFLTFAVYLIQLVMMLFRNLGNNAPTAATPTVLFNRARRSTNEFNEDTARILEYLDSFAKNPYPE